MGIFSQWATSMRIIVGASLSIPPYSPGRAWHRLQYLRGLQKLGHDVYFVEELSPESCLDRRGQQVGFDEGVNRELFHATLEPYGLMERACLIYGRGEVTLGLSRNCLASLSKTTDLLINWSGHITSDFILGEVKRRAFLDLDPVFTQVWVEAYGMDLNFRAHDVFFSTGLNIGTPHTVIPDCGVMWRHILPPVVLEDWPWRVDPSCRRFTTVATLSPFGDVYYRGKRYGTKYDELSRLADLPRRAKAELEIALKYHREEEAGLRVLADQGWALTDGGSIADLQRYQDYIGQSRGEIGITQNAYIAARSGWFSDRWSHYLASGRPVLAQSTDFERWLPTGRGILTFNDMDEAVKGIEEINRDYTAHCRAAREFAEEFLDHRKVLPRLLDTCTAA